jgi:hypothetical protein
MMYPCSPSLQSLPVPGVGFCQSIFVDRCAVDQPHRRAWPFVRGWAQVSAETDRTPREAANMAAAAYQLH